MQQIRLKSNPPSKIEGGVGGADVPKALFHIRVSAIKTVLRCRDDLHPPG